VKATTIPEAADPSGAAIQSKPNPVHRILVVEDDDDIRRINVEVLIKSGYQVDAAENGSVAWDNLQLNSYDLVITDNEMPKVSGVELLKKLSAAHMALPVIMATGNLPKDEFTRHPEIHPAAMLLKPYSCMEFLETVREVLCATRNDGREIGRRFALSFEDFRS
jgi:DNA-binding response OmpR family regulator